jgi:hypothetical protein
MRWSSIKFGLEGCLQYQGIAFRVQGSGFRVQGLGCLQYQGIAATGARSAAAISRLLSVGRCSIVANIPRHAGADAVCLWAWMWCVCGRRWWHMAVSGYVGMLELDL